MGKKNDAQSNTDYEWLNQTGEQQMTNPILDQATLLAQFKIAAEPEIKTAITAKKGTPAQRFIEAVSLQLGFIDEKKKIHKISEKISAEGLVRIMDQSELLKPPIRGKSQYWFCWKNGKLVISAYYSNATLYPPISVANWEEATKYLLALKEVAIAGKLDANFSSIDKTREEAKAIKRAAKRGETANKETGEIEDTE